MTPGVIEEFDRESRAARARARARLLFVVLNKTEELLLSERVGENGESGANGEGSGVASVKRGSSFDTCQRGRARKE